MRCGVAGQGHDRHDRHNKKFWMGKATSVGTSADTGRRGVGR